MKQYYFDNAATSYPKSPKVYEALDIANRSYSFNAGRGAYKRSRNVTNLIDDTRSRLLDIVNGSEKYDVIFSPSATIAFNQIIFGLEYAKDEYVYISPFEHNAVVRVLHQAQKKYGFNIKELPIKENYSLDMEKTEFLFSQMKPAKVFVTYVSNVTGYILPILEMSKLVKKYDGKIIVDGSQAIGLVPTDLRQMHIDIMVFAGHKTLYGPFGIGGFYIKKGVSLMPYIAGGTGSDSLNPEMPNDLPLRLEAGSPNSVAIAGLNEALKEIELSDIQLNYFQHEKRITDYFVSELEKIDGVKLYVPYKENHISIVAWNLIGYNSAEVGDILGEEYGIEVRTGYHCTPYIHKYLDNQQFLGVVRASIGRYTEEKDVDYFVNAVREIVEDY